MRAKALKLTQNTFMCITGKTNENARLGNKWGFEVKPGFTLILLLTAAVCDGCFSPGMDEQAGR